LHKISGFAKDSCGGGNMDISKHKMYATDMPMGLDMALAKNKEAFDYFYSLPEAEQKQIIENTHVISCKEEMQAYADSLVN